MSTTVAVEDKKIDPHVDKTPEGESGGDEEVDDLSNTEKDDPTKEVGGDNKDSETNIVGQGSETEEDGESSSAEVVDDAVSSNTADSKIRIVDDKTPLKVGEEIPYTVTDGKVVGPDGNELEDVSLKTKIIDLVKSQGGGRRRSRRHSRRHSKKRHNKRSKKQNGGKKRNSKKNSKRHSKRNQKK